MQIGRTYKIIDLFYTENPDMRESRGFSCTPPFDAQHLHPLSAPLHKTGPLLLQNTLFFEKEHTVLDCRNVKIFQGIKTYP